MRTSLLELLIAANNLFLDILHLNILYFNHSFSFFIRTIDSFWFPLSVLLPDLLFCPADHHPAARAQGLLGEQGKAEQGHRARHDLPAWIKEKGGGACKEKKWRGQHLREKPPWDVKEEKNTEHLSSLSITHIITNRETWRHFPR